MLRIFERLRNRMSALSDSVSGRKRLAAREERHMESETQGSETGEVPKGWVEAPNGFPPCCSDKSDPDQHK